MLAWVITNIFQILGVLGTIVGGAWLFMKEINALDMRVSQLEINAIKLESSINEKLADIKSSLKEVQVDIKELMKDHK